MKDVSDSRGAMKIHDYFSIGSGFQLNRRV